MAKQVRVRRDTLTNLNGVIPADGELAYNLTDDRLHMGDGATLGGIPHVNYRDLIGQKFEYATETGAVNSLVVTLPYAPSAYSQMRIRVKIGTTNTGATVINVNGLGSKNIYKVSAGTIGNLVAGDLLAGSIVELAYDGTQFQLLTITKSGITTVKQGNLDTSQGTVSNTNTTYGIYALPGGSYGFYPEINCSTTANGTWFATLYGAGVSTSFTNTSLTAYAAYITLQSGSASWTITARQRYVNASPPFDVDGHEAAGFFFALMNDAGEIVGHYLADVPPWAYNGPTNIRADFTDSEGKKFRKHLAKRSLREHMDGAEMKFELQEITMEMKNADMDLIPHPFMSFEDGLTPILLDTTDVRIRRMVELQNNGGGDEITEAISKGFIKVDNSAVKRRGSKLGVPVHRLEFQY